jgi:hypothetical protein
MSKTLRTAVLATLALTGTLAAGAARASDVHWSIGLNAPLHSGVSIGTVISNSPGYGYYRPAPIYYSAPAPVYYSAPAYGYYAPPVYHAAPRYRDGHRHRHDNRRYRDRDRDGIPDRWDRHPRYPDRPVYGPYGR